MSRVLLLSEVFPPKTGGSGRWFWEIYRRLPREQVVVCAGEGPRQSEFDEGHDLNVVRSPLALADWGIMGRKGLLGYWRAAASVRRVLKRRPIDQVHCGKVLAEGLIAWWFKLWRGIPYLCYVHGEELMVFESSRELRWLARGVLKRASLVVANSQNTSSLLEHWNVPPDKIRVLHPGADTRRFVPAKRNESIRATLGWSSRTVILTAGRLQRRKGQDMLIRSLSAIRRAIPDVLCSIVGDGDDREYLNALARSEGVTDCVEFRGEPADEELTHCYQQCDLFVLANRRVGDDIEGFGMVLVEAQACGKPVIAGDSGGTRETMHLGETGRIVDCTSPSPLAAAVLDLLGDSDRRAAMGQAARAWAVAQFDWETLALQATQIFAELTPSHKSAAGESSYEPAKHPSSVESRRNASLVLSAQASLDRSAKEY